MNDDAGRQHGKAALQKCDIFVHLQNRDQPFFICQCQIRAAQHVQKMQLDPVHTDLSQMACRLHDHFRRLAGKTQNHVRNDLDIQCMKPIYRRIENGQPVAAADIARGFVVHGLKPQLNEYGLLFTQAREHAKDIFRQTVRARGNGKRDDIVRLHRLQKQRLQPGYIPVGIRELLKIGDEPGVMRFFAENQLCLLQLFRNGSQAGRGKLAASRAEHAASCTERSVAVRAGAACGKRKLADLAAEAIFEVRAQRIVMFHSVS